MPITAKYTEAGPGAYGASEPNVPGIPTFDSHTSSTITFAFTANGNDAVVEYAIYVTKDDEGVGYLDSEGADNGDSEIWQTLADWGATVTATGLSSYSKYEIKVKAKNEMDSESEFCTDSAVMNTDPGIVYNETSDNLDREVTGGNTIVSGTPSVSGNYATDEENSYYGDITITYTLKNNSSTESRVVVEFSEDYDPDDVADVADPDNAEWNTATEGEGGDGLTGLNTSPAGEEHTYVFDSYESCGKSELDLVVHLRITPSDASPTGGDADSAVLSAPFGVNNRPTVITWTNDDTYAWDKDTTPVFIATIPYLRGGTKGFPSISFYTGDEGADLDRQRKSIEDIRGWSYETETDSWTALTVAGIPDTVIDGTNRVLT